MNSGFKARWQQLRSRFWLSLVFDVVVLLAVFLGIHSWQTRNLPVDQPAPFTSLSVLGSSETLSVASPGETGIVYFFAPWCFYCRNSIGNLQDLVDENHISWGIAIALVYSDEQEVQAFVDETGVTVPVLLGTTRTAADWGVRAFPTYYVIDAEGRIDSRSVGYSTQLGMLARGYLARHN
jgi:thiol-disulfide isomerase/thioredoxin